jgi:hypothetical protein
MSPGSIARLQAQQTLKSPFGASEIRQACQTFSSKRAQKMAWGLKMCPSTSSALD